MLNGQWTEIGNFTLAKQTPKGAFLGGVGQKIFYSNLKASKNILFAFKSLLLGYVLEVLP